MKISKMLLTRFLPYPIIIIKMEKVDFFYGDFVNLKNIYCSKSLVVIQ